MPLTGALLRYLRKNEFSWGGGKALPGAGFLVFVLSLNEEKIKSWYKGNGSH